MKDIKGIERGNCVACGEGECEEFVQDGKNAKCGYCDCPPVKHNKLKVGFDDNDKVSVRRAGITRLWPS